MTNATPTEAGLDQFSTTDGQLITRADVEEALRHGKAVCIGEIFVGFVTSDAPA